MIFFYNRDRFFAFCIFHMSKKHFFIVFLLSFCFFWYTISGLSFYRNSGIVYLGNSSWNIYLESQWVSQVIVLFASSFDISHYSISSNCETNTQFLSTKDGQTRFELSLSKDCTNNQFYLQDGDGNIIVNTNFSLSFIRDFDLYNMYSDYSNLVLEHSKQVLQTKVDKLKVFSKANPKTAPLGYLKKYHESKEYEYQVEKIEEILEKRTNKYLIPIAWKSIPDEKHLSKFPNAHRPYRAWYTYGVHEGIDIDAPNNTPTLALDDGIIVRIVDGFVFEDLNALKRWSSLTHQDKLNNLDILRGNQVWLKTMKWDIAFYSHLSSIEPGLQVGDRVHRWDILWKTWITWVPDRDYSDYHLHLELKKNPYTQNKAGKNTFFDYMNWDWYFKWMSVKEILATQYDYFE